MCTAEQNAIPSATPRRLINAMINSARFPSKSATGLATRFARSADRVYPLSASNGVANWREMKDEQVCEFGKLRRPSELDGIPWSGFWISGWIWV